ncbi:MAG: HAD family hydrolase [Saezia sp.]
MENSPLIKAITLDLDDTLWPVWPAIWEAEKHLYNWMCERAPATAAANNIETLSAARKEVEELYPEHKHNLSFYRREAIRRLLKQHGDDETLAEEGFDVFFAARQNVDIFADVIPALELLSARYPIIAITNGNANLEVIGLWQFFKGFISAQQFGICKPDKAIFLEAARILEIDAPSHILHIGDDFKLDIQAAKQVGFQTAWIRRPELNIPQATDDELHAADLIATDLADLCQQLKL